MESGVLVCKRPKRSHSSYCAAVNCKNSRGKRPDLSFFSFPNDLDRAKSWAINVYRDDLVHKTPEYLNKNCTVCSEHFETIMFLNDLKNRLHSHAIPTIMNVSSPPQTVKKGKKILRIDRDLRCRQESTMMKNHTSVNRLERLAKNFFLDRLSEAHHEITRKSYSCNICNREFPQRFKLIIHLRTHTGAKPYKCKFCKKAFANSSSLDTHFRTHTGEKPYKCNFCNKAFAQCCNLATHFRTHTGEKPYICNLCNKAFTRKSFLDQHIRTHTGEKLYKCNFCHRVFARWNVIMLHLKTHTAEKTYNCQFTNQRLTHLDDHNYHINSGYGPYKTVSCQSVVSSMTEGCNGSTSPKRSTTYTHDDSFCIENLLAENQYNGNICHKRSAQINDVKSHKRAHTGEKPYRCELCSKVFAQNANLKYHLRIHAGEKPFKCELCNKLFARNANLKYHLRIHTGEKPYNCRLCHKAFVGKGVLKTHLKTHTAEKPYKCNYYTCRKVFAERTSLRRHIESHNRENSELYQSVVLGMTETNHRHISSKTFAMCDPDSSCSDEKEFPATENSQHFTSMQSLNLSPHKNHFSGHQSTIAADINPVVVRTYGCGLCDGMFEIEKEFVEHCYNHYDIAPNFTFVDLFEGHHSSCCC